MFDIGFAEILVIAVVTLLVMGPERLPHALRTAALWLGRAKRHYQTIKQEVENEIGMDDVRRQIHNEGIMRDLESAKASVESIDSSAETLVRENIKQPLEGIIKESKATPIHNHSDQQSSGQADPSGTVRSADNNLPEPERALSDITSPDTPGTPTNSTR